MHGAHMKPEYMAMNPFRHIPTLQDGEVILGESTAILRYLALQYKPEYYPTADPAVSAKLDFAMESFDFEVYPAHKETVQPLLGFVPAPSDQAAAYKKYSGAFDAWTSHFLKGKFVCGDIITIADFKVVPFFFAAMQPVVKNKTGLAPNERAIQYVEDFCAAVASATMLREVY